MAVRAMNCSLITGSVSIVSSGFVLPKARKIGRTIFRKIPQLVPELRAMRLICRRITWSGTDVTNVADATNVAAVARGGGGTRRQRCTTSELAHLDDPRGARALDEGAE